MAQLDRPADRRVGLRAAALGPARGTPSRSARREQRRTASSAAATRATSACRVGRCSSAAVRRSSHDVSMSPARTSGRSSRSSRNDRFVVPPRTTTVICDSARCSRASASPRSRPWAMTLAIIESYSGGMTSPSATPVSTRMPGPTGSVSISIVPGRRGERPLRVLGVEAGLDGVALGRRRLALQAAAGGDVQLQLDEVEPGRQLGDRVLDLQAGVDLEEREALLGRLVQELDRAGVLVAGDAWPGARPPPAGRGPAPASAPCTATPRSPSGCAAACCSRARRPPTPCRGRRRSAGPRRGGRR